MENSHHLSSTLTCPPSSEIAQALEHCWFMSTQRMTWKLPHSFMKEHRRSRGSWPEPDRQRLWQDRAALIPPTVHTNTPFPGPRGFTDPVPQSVVIFSLPTLNLWRGMLSAGGTRGFLGAFIFLFQIQFVFFSPLPFNLFPQIIRKSQDSSRFILPQRHNFYKWPKSRRDISPDFKSVSIYCLDHTVWSARSWAQCDTWNVSIFLGSNAARITYMKHTPCTWKIHSSDVSVHDTTINTAAQVAKLRDIPEPWLSAFCSPKPYWLFVHCCYHTIPFHDFFVYKAWCGLTLDKPSNFISYHIPPQTAVS